MTIVIYTSKNCEPCKEVKKLLKNTEFEEHVEVVDIDTEEGFKRFSDEVLSKGDAAIPSAYRNGSQCKILLADDDTIMLDCPDDPPT